MSLKLDNQFIEEPWLKKTIPLRIDKIGIIHNIVDLIQENYFDLMSNFNVGLEVFFYYFLILLSSLFMFSIIVSLSNKLQTGPKILQSTVLEFLFFKYFLTKRSGSSICLFLICYNFYHWHTLIFFTNNTKTNKVIERKLIDYLKFKSSKINCF